MAEYVVNYAEKARGGCQQCKEKFQDVSGEERGGAGRPGSMSGCLCKRRGGREAAAGDRQLDRLVSQGDMRIGTRSESKDGKVSTRWKHW